EDLNAGVEHGHYSSALCHMANISYRLGESVPFNGKTNRLGDNHEVVETFRNLQENLRGVGVRLEDTNYQLGRTLSVDPAGERFVDRQLKALPLPANREDWLRARQKLRSNILAAIGLTDLLPPAWDLKVQQKGVLSRDGYRIEKLTYESYPGMAIPALLYVPDDVGGRVPCIVSITGHTPVSKAADYIQQRNVNLVRRGCVVLCYDYYGYGERKTGDKPDYP